MSKKKTKPRSSTVKLLNRQSRTKLRDTSWLEIRLRRLKMFQNYKKKKKKSLTRFNDHRVLRSKRWQNNKYSKTVCTHGSFVVSPTNDKVNLLLLSLILRFVPDDDAFLACLDSRHSFTKLILECRVLARAHTRRKDQQRRSFNAITLIRW